MRKGTKIVSIITGVVIIILVVTGALILKGFGGSGDGRQNTPQTSKDHPQKFCTVDKVDGRFGEDVKDAGQESVLSWTAGAPSSNGSVAISGTLEERDRSDRTGQWYDMGTPRPFQGTQVGDKITIYFPDRTDPVTGTIENGKLRLDAQLERLSLVMDLNCR
ncbi:hypothetical protein [Actinoallomurus sp. NPDC052274]|uniref:hypothetical protein n=1 Tax=Actinoallomurus sp. NPDC052274 TaxID=3155420 RepID=UPI003434F10C